MGSPALPDNFEIAPGYRVKDWKGLTLSEANGGTTDWNKAISIFDTRIRSRFIEPAQLLIDAEGGGKRGTNGFAVLAIDFLLIETIQGFRRGLINHNGKSKELFKAFLTNWPTFLECLPLLSSADDLAGAVYEQGRCALHHTGSTDRIIVRKSGAMFVFHEDGQIVINRTLLHQQLVKAFDVYVAALRDPASTAMREKFKQKMDHICL
jgi:hypothetical protein